MSCLACSDRSGPGWMPSARSSSAAGRAGSPASPSTGCNPICARWWKTTLTTLHGLNVSAAGSSGSVIEAPHLCGPRVPTGKGNPHALHHTPMGEPRPSQHETSPSSRSAWRAPGRYGWDHVADVGMAPPLRIIEVPKGRLVVEGHPRGGRWGAATRDPRGASLHLASARERFLTAEPVTPRVVRRSILASWTRSRNWNVPADHFGLPYDPNPNR